MADGDDTNPPPDVYTPQPNIVDCWKQTVPGGINPVFEDGSYTNKKGKVTLPDGSIINVEKGSGSETYTLSNGAYIEFFSKPDGTLSNFNIGLTMNRKADLAGLGQTSLNARYDNNGDLYFNTIRYDERNHKNIKHYLTPEQAFALAKKSPFFSKDSSAVDRCEAQVMEYNQRRHPPESKIKVDPSNITNVTIVTDGKDMEVFLEKLRPDLGPSVLTLEKLPPFHNITAIHEKNIQSSGKPLAAPADSPVDSSIHSSIYTSIINNHPSLAASKQLMDLVATLEKFAPNASYNIETMTEAEFNNTYGTKELVVNSQISRK